MHACTGEYVCIHVFMTIYSYASVYIANISMKGYKDLLVTKCIKVFAHLARIIIFGLTDPCKSMPKPTFLLIKLFQLYKDKNVLVKPRVGSRYACMLVCVYVYVYMCVCVCASCLLGY